MNIIKQIIDDTGYKVIYAEYTEEEKAAALSAVVKLSFDQEGNRQ